MNHTTMEGLVSNIIRVNDHTNTRIMPYLWGYTPGVFVLCRFKGLSWYRRPQECEAVSPPSSQSGPGEASGINGL